MVSSYFVCKHEKSVYETMHSVKNVTKCNLKTMNHEKMLPKKSVTSNENIKIVQQYIRVQNELILNMKKGRIQYKKVLSEKTLS